MTTPCIKVTQVKLDVRKIIENLKHLENHEENQYNKLNVLQNETENLLSYLESLPLEAIQAKLGKRQKRRYIKRLRKAKLQEKETSFKNNTSEEILTNSSSTLSQNTKIKLKRHHQLQSLEECQRFLKTFELIDQLHLARGQNPSKSRKFSSKLQQLKSVWNCLLQEQQLEHITVEQLWHEVLFGPPEKTYFQEKPDLNNFVKKRRIWDSYIDSRHGSSIPTGWVLPPLNPKPEWHNFLMTPQDK